jgi:hypothetical protein
MYLFKCYIYFFFFFIFQSLSTVLKYINQYISEYICCCIIRITVEFNVCHPNVFLKFPHLSSPPYKLYVPPILFFSILSPKKYFVRSSLCNYIHSLFTSSLFYILHITLFSNTINPRPFLNVSDQVSHPYKTTGILYIYNIIYIINILKIILFLKSVSWLHDGGPRSKSG